MFVLPYLLSPVSCLLSCEAEYVANVRADPIQSIPRTHHAPELPRVLARADHVTHRLLDAVDGARLAGTRVVQQRLRRRHGGGVRIAADPDLLTARRRAGGSIGQEKTRHVRAVPAGRRG